MTPAWTIKGFQKKMIKVGILIATLKSQLDNNFILVSAVGFVIF